MLHENEIYKQIQDLEDELPNFKNLRTENKSAKYDEWISQSNYLKNEILQLQSDNQKQLLDKIKKFKINVNSLLKNCQLSKRPI